MFTIRFGEDQKQCENSSQTCCKRDKIKTEEQPRKKHCGEQMNVTVKPRIFETTIVNDSTEYPWTMAVFKKTNGIFTFLCGASLLGPKVALTVIHNIPEMDDNSSLVIRAGEYDLTNDNEWLKHQERIVTRIVKNPQYENSSHTYDTALLFWDEPLDMSYANVNTICLPNKNEVFDNLNCRVTGWGTSDICLYI